MKIVASSDPISVNTSYSAQMLMLMKDIKAEWHYVQNGVGIGRAVEHKEIGNVTVYPGRSADSSASPGQVRHLARKEDADLLFLYEGPSYLSKYTTFMPPLPYTGICWFPWDTDEWSNTLTVLLRSCEDHDFMPVVISKASEKLIKERGYQVEQVYNIVDDHVYRPVESELIYNEKKAFLRAMGKDEDSKILLYVGRMTPRKNIESLFAMVRQLRNKRKDFVLIIHGDIADPGASCDPRMEVISRYIVNRVGFHIIKWDVGISKENMNMLYNCADVYVSASGGEGFGLPVCEAGLCGKPFVVPDNTTGPEFSQNGMHGLLATNSNFYREYKGLTRQIVDAKSMADQVDWLLDDVEQRRSMGMTFRKWILENCSREIISNKFKGLMKEFIPLECGVDAGDE